MKSIIDKYKFDGIWHFTDKSNIELIVQNQGLYSLVDLKRKGIAIPAPGGNQWSHDADALKGVHEYVHLAFLDNHPMLYAAKQDGRIKEPVWLKIDSSILLDSGVKFTKEVSNNSNSRYPSVIRASQICEGFDFYRHNHTLQALKACPNTA